MWDKHEPETIISYFDLWIVGDLKTSAGAWWVSISICAAICFQIEGGLGNVTEGEQNYAIAIDKPFVAIEAQPGASSFAVVQSFLGWIKGNQEQTGATGRDDG